MIVQKLFQQIAIVLDARYLSMVLEPQRRWAVVHFLPGPHRVELLVRDHERNVLVQNSSIFWAIDVFGPSHELRCEIQSVKFDALLLVQTNDNVKLKPRKLGVESRVPSLLPEWGPTLKCIEHLETTLPDFWLPTLIRAKIQEDLGNLSNAIDLWEKLMHLPEHEDFMEQTQSHPHVVYAQSAVSEKFWMEWPIPRNMVQ